MARINGFAPQTVLFKAALEYRPASSSLRTDALTPEQTLVAMAAPKLLLAEGGHLVLSVGIELGILLDKWLHAFFVDTGDDLAQRNGNLGPVAGTAYDFRQVSYTRYRRAHS